MSIFSLLLCDWYPLWVTRTSPSLPPDARVGMFACWLGLQPMKELRVKGSYVHHKEIKGALGVKIVGQNLETVLAGTPVFVLNPEDDEEELKHEVTPS